MDDSDRTGDSGRTGDSDRTEGGDRAEAGGRTEDGGRPLSERDLAVLALERRSWSGPGAKERAVRERLGITPTRYYQLLNALLDDPRALAHDPVTVNRLRRLREARRARR
ncbi:DUF3263 domain-containing protein [Streptomyces huiliensis]|uniref:DUF3263 domain-containing protein n=1 Tax=Streptomyces huiliensis TaxID=2876027 RepID=UPI0021E0CC12|nr:DUF3263 domain-containing protein [Streptomyces huiliensis]